MYTQDKDIGPLPEVKKTSPQDLALREQGNGRLIGLRTNRYSWWCHWRELADYILPRRYKWIITPNQMARGSPINQHILDSACTIAARDLAAGMTTGCTNPAKHWFRLKVGDIDATQTSPASLWIKQVEDIIYRIFQESSYYTSAAVYFFDLAVFGTAASICYEDFENVACWYNPCLGEYYCESSAKLHVDTLYREFTYTVSQTVQEFGLENCSPAIQRLYRQGGANLTRELVIAHAIEPNDDGKAKKFGFPEEFKFREWYWEWGGSASPQGGSSYAPGVLRKRGFHEMPMSVCRWDTVSNDAYGRSPGMDGLPDSKQLQLETKRKAQAIDKVVNPPMVADVQLKNQPASLLPGGITYVSGMTTGKVGFAPVYEVKPDIAAIAEDLNEVRDRIRKIFYVDLFKVISQFETRSNVTAVEIEARRAEALVMLGPVLERINYEKLAPDVERVFAMANRAGILPPAPAEIQGKPIKVAFVSMLEVAQRASEGAGIERILALVGQLMGIDPAAADNVDIDYAIDKLSYLLNNDPKLIRSPDQLAEIRTNRMKQQQQAEQVDQAQKLAVGAKTLAETPIGGTRTALQAITGAA